MKNYARDRGDIYLPTPEVASNPLRSGKLRNVPCICGSGRKIKSCCGKPHSVKASTANIIKNLVLDGQKILEQELAAHKSTEGVMNGNTDERP